MKNYLQTPQEIRQQIWQELARACQDRHHAWRTPVLATVATDGCANARTVVLRSVDATRGTLVCYTDKRTPKVAEIGIQQNAMLVFWSSRLNWQLRVRVDMSVQTRGPEVDALWSRVKQTAGANDYLQPALPGSPLCDAEKISETLQDHHFSVLCAAVTEMDWLELRREGHRRARIFSESWQWLLP
jgi:pyridoxamine 5'-phosphate oxidase